MGLTNVKGTPSENTYELPKDGTSLGRLTAIYDVGMQNREYNGKELDPAQGIVLIYSLMSDKKEDGSEKTISTGFKFPLTISFDFKTGGLNEKSKLYKHVMALSGTEKFDGNILALLGNAVSLTITHKVSKSGDNNKFAVITSVGSVPDIEGFKVPETTTDKIYFDTETATKEQYDALPDYVKDVLKKAVNFNTMVFNSNLTDTEPELDDEIPF